MTRPVAKQTRPGITTVANAGAGGSTSKQSSHTAKSGTTPGTIGGVATTSVTTTSSLRTAAEIAADRDPNARQRVIERAYGKPQGKL